ncbi:hypothetical protein Tco_1095069, partial [Tanacetum coccineum]
MHADSHHRLLPCHGCCVSNVTTAAAVGLARMNRASCIRSRLSWQQALNSDQVPSRKQLEDPEAKEDREVMLLASDVVRRDITRTSVRTMEVKAVETKFEATNKILKTIRGRIKETLKEITKHQPALKEDAEHLAEYTAYVQKLRDGENLDKMKEKGDPCVMVGYSTQSKGYRVYNKRTRLIVESIHINFNEIKEMMSDHNSSDLAPQRQEIQNVVPTADKTGSSQQGLEFLFSPLLEEYYNPTHDQAEDNNNDQAPNASFQEAEFINPFCTRVQEIGESSSRNIDNTDVHSFQPQSHEYRWTRDHPLEQVRGNPTMPVQTRRQLATDPEM